MTASEGVSDEPIEAVLDLPIRYIDRSRAYYLGLGYGNPYRWASNQDVAFAPLAKPIAGGTSRANYDGGAVQAGSRRPGTLGGVQRRSKVR